MDDTPTNDQTQTTSEVKQGIRAYGLRQIGGQLLGIGYSILIARILGPYEFGIFAICGSVLALLSLSGNAGLAAPIIRSRETPSEALLRTLFTTYLTLALVVAGMIWAVAPLLPEIYPKLEPDHVWLIRLMAVGIVLNSLGGVSYALLEREMRFRQVAGVEFAQTVLFSLSALFLAYRGLGVWALGFASLIRTLSGSVGLLVLRPWGYRPGFNWEEFRQVMPVSLAIQASAITAAIREQFYPLLVGSLCGPVALGYLTWAKSSASKPMEVVSMFDRIALSWYARVNRDHGDLDGVVTTSITMLASVLYPLVGLMLAMGESAIRYIYGPKWLPALPAFSVLCLALLAVPLRGPLQNAIDSQAKAAVLYRCALIGLVAQWSVGILGILAWGYVGAALAHPAQLAAISCFCYLQTRNMLKVKLLPLLVRPALHGLVGYLLASLLIQQLARSTAGFLLASLLSACLFLMLAPYLQPAPTRKWLGFIRDTLPFGPRRAAQPVSSN